ncbi:unnamed protein product [Rhizophagus irregularis]|nr:unnamed protein product [Rhizophagus irregularis]
MSQIISLRKLIITEFTPENKDMMISFRHMKPFRYGNTKVPPLKTPKSSPENIMKILTELRDRMLNNLSEFYCYSNTYPEFFYRLSQICHTIQTLKISLTTDDISKELIDLISVQKNLKNLYMLQLRYESNRLLNEFLENNGRIPEELELFLESWKSRVPQKPLSLVITGYHTFIENDGNMKVIEKYTELGTIKLVNKPIDNLYKYDSIVIDQLSNRY